MGNITDSLLLQSGQDKRARGTLFLRAIEPTSSTAGFGFSSSRKLYREALNLAV